MLKKLPKEEKVAERIIETGPQNTNIIETPRITYSVLR